MKNKILTLLVLVFSFNSLVGAEDCFPTALDGIDLVYDETNSISLSEKNNLNNFLIDISNNTSNQIVVAIVGDLCGMDRATYATELGHEWGVGRDGKDNGIVILVKPTKTNGPRTTFIAVGYGLEGTVPDATAKLIVENEMNPRFKNGNIYEGLMAGLNVLVPLIKKEFDYVAYEQKQQSSQKNSKGIPYIFVVIIIFVILSKIFGARNYANQNGISIWSALWLGSMMGSSYGGSGRSGGYSDFSSGGGGFGGFGGGGFGGGGAGGDW